MSFLIKYFGYDTSLENAVQNYEYGIMSRLSHDKFWVGMP